MRHVRHDSCQLVHVPVQAAHLEANNLQELEAVWRAGHFALERRVADANPSELFLAWVGCHITYVPAYDAYMERMRSPLTSLHTTVARGGHERGSWRSSD